MQKKKKMYLFLLVFLATFMVVTNVQAKTVKLNKKSATVYVGKTVNLKVVGTAGKIKWKSKNPKIASVSKTGKVKGKKVGKTTITAIYNGKKMTCTVTVKRKKGNRAKETTEATEQKIEVSLLSLNKTSVKLVQGNSETLQLTIVPANATNKTVIWQSADTRVATVNNGVITAVGEGVTKIFVTSQNGKTASCNVQVVTDYLGEYRKLSAYEKMAVYTFGKIYEKEKCNFTPYSIDIIDYYVPIGYYYLEGNPFTLETQYDIYYNSLRVSYKTPSFSGGIVPYYVSYFKADGTFIPYGQSKKAETKIVGTTKWEDNNYRSMDELYRIYLGLTELGYDVKNPNSLE